MIENDSMQDITRARFNKIITILTLTFSYSFMQKLNGTTKTNRMEYNTNLYLIK